MTRRPSIPDQMKEQLIREAGSKCANPGCPVLRTHIHHIKEWSVYQTHDKQHMIAICPTCHDRVHHGKLKVTDEDIYAWKGIKRSPVKTSHFYIEPAETHSIMLGKSLQIVSKTPITFFEPSSSQRFKYRVLDGQFVILDLEMSTLSGQKLLKISENNVTQQVEAPLTFIHEPGHLRISAPANFRSKLIPFWATQLLEELDIPYETDGALVLLDMEVTAPNVVNLTGIWADHRSVVVVSDKTFAGLYGNTVLINGQRCGVSPKYFLMHDLTLNIEEIETGPFKFTFFGFPDNIEIENADARAYIRERTG